MIKWFKNKFKGKEKKKKYIHELTIDTKSNKHYFTHKTSLDSFNNFIEWFNSNNIENFTLEINNGCSIFKKHDIISVHLRTLEIR